MGLTYFKRYRMDYDLSRPMTGITALPPSYELVSYSDDLLREHAAAKYQSFREELDSNVFPCLSQRDGCIRLMREITQRSVFVPDATWLVRYFPSDGSRSQPVGTIQGLEIEGIGSIQNIGVDPEHRGKGLGSILVARAAEGFRRAGLLRMQLEVTTDNTAAIRLYERLGFIRRDTVYKAAEVAGV